MKKRFMALICAALMMLALSSCGQDFVGKWQTKEVKKNDMTSNSDYEKETGLPVGSAYQLEIREDGTGTVRKSKDLKEEAIEWKEEGGRLMIRRANSDDADYTSFSLENGELSAVDKIRIPYGIYSTVSSAGFINSVVCEKVDSFYNTTELRSYALSCAGKGLYAEVSTCISDLKEQGRYKDIPTGKFRFDLKQDTAVTDLQKSIAFILEDYGLTDASAEIYIDRNIYTCENIRITDSNGVTGEFDTQEFSRALGIGDFY